jgi:hypothetical protein
LKQSNRATNESGQSLFETLLMVWLLTLLISAIIQVFLIHNYTFQMANNAYYSLFAHKAYQQYSPGYKKGFAGFPNWPKKPLRAVTALQQAGGRVHDEAGGPVNWSEDDRASLPVMPYFEDEIVEALKRAGITRDQVRLKVGTPLPGKNYLDMKFLRMAMGTEGGFGAFGTMISGLVRMAGKLGTDYTNYTGGYSDDFLEGLEGQYNNQSNELGGQEDGQAAKDAWDENHFDFDHDGYNDFTNAKNDRPWE